jgi:hypothetical protein
MGVGSQASAPSSVRGRRRLSLRCVCLKAIDLAALYKLYQKIASRTIAPLPLRPRVTRTARSASAVPGSNVHRLASDSCGAARAARSVRRGFSFWTS